VLAIFAIGECEVMAERSKRAKIKFKRQKVVSTVCWFIEKCKQFIISMFQYLCEGVALFAVAIFKTLISIMN